MAITSYADFQKYMNDILKKNATDISSAPHKAFWNKLTEQEFRTGNVPNVQPPTRICIPGDGKGSNIVQALQGVGLFDGSTFRRMPADGSPFFTDDQIKPVIDWIDSMPK
jgi:hypothetical protein